MLRSRMGITHLFPVDLYKPLFLSPPFLFLFCWCWCPADEQTLPFLISLDDYPSAWVVCLASRVPPYHLVVASFIALTPLCSCMYEMYLIRNVLLIALTYQSLDSRNQSRLVSPWWRVAWVTAAAWLAWTGLHGGPHNHRLGPPYTHTISSMHPTTPTPLLRHQV